MRYYAIHCAESIGAAAEAPSLLGRLFRNWRTRRRLARLTDLDDPMLKDIGFTREELSRALNLPLTVSASEELEQSALRRRLGEARAHLRAKLAEPDDRTLQDVGLTEEELGWALGVPLTLNPTEELEQRALRSRIRDAGHRRPRRGSVPAVMAARPTRSHANELERIGQSSLKKTALTVLVVAGSLVVAMLAPERQPADVLGLQFLVADGPARQK